MKQHNTRGPQYRMYDLNVNANKLHKHSFHMICTFMTNNLTAPIVPNRGLYKGVLEKSEFLVNINKTTCGFTERFDKKTDKYFVMDVNMRHDGNVRLNTHIPLKDPKDEAKLLKLLRESR